MFSLIPASFLAVSTLFMPKNDLWRYDNVDLYNNISQELFQKIISAGYQAYLPDAQKNGESLKINALWDNSTTSHQLPLKPPSESLALF